MPSPRYLPVEQFRSLGLLQEVNRRLLHPCGLALEVTFTERTPLWSRIPRAVLAAWDVLLGRDAGWRLSGVWDYRADPEGMAYGEAPSRGKSIMFRAMYEGKRAVRTERFGWHVQPVGEAGSPLSDGFEDVSGGGPS